MKHLQSDARRFVEGIVGHLRKDTKARKSYPKIQNLLKKVSSDTLTDQTAHITTAVPLIQSEKELVMSVLSKKLNKQIFAVYHTDPAIIAGVRIEIKDSIIDTSFVEQLRQIESELLKDKSL